MEKLRECLRRQNQQWIHWRISEEVKKKKKKGGDLCKAVPGLGGKASPHLYAVNWRPVCTQSCQSLSVMSQWWRYLPLKSAAALSPALTRRGDGKDVHDSAGGAFIICIDVTHVRKDFNMHEKRALSPWVDIRRAAGARTHCDLSVDRLWHVFFFLFKQH